jgi:hypothetical protein
VPPAVPVPPPRPPRPRRSKRTRRLLLGILAAVVALVVAVAVYAFALHPGLSMFGMPSAMRSAASPWWSVSRGCQDLSARSANTGLASSTGETAINAVATDSRSTWKCTISPSVSDSTTAAYLIFVYDGPSEQDSSQKLQSYWRWERTKYYDPHTDLGTSYITQRGTRTDHGLVCVFWLKNDNDTDLVSAFLVSKPNGDYTKLLDLWHQHAVVDKTPS